MTQLPAASAIAGAVLPLGRAQELIATLQSVVSARIVAGENGVIDAVHVLVTGELTPKQVVRNIESALMAHLGMKVDHRKISVAATSARPTPATPAAGVATTEMTTEMEKQRVATMTGRHLYFEDVEIRGSRTKGSTCRVTLRRGDQSWVGEADGVESTRARIELAARAALAAIKQFEGNRRAWELAGVKKIEAFGVRPLRHELQLEVDLANVDLAMHQNAHTGSGSHKPRRRCHARRPMSTMVRAAKNMPVMRATLMPSHAEKPDGTV